MDIGELIPELGRILHGRTLKIWKGTAAGLTPERMERYRAAWRARPETVGAPADDAPRLSRICIYEGPIVEHAPCNCGDKHVRLCFHPNGEFDRCTRGPVRGSPYPACSACPLRVAD